MRGHWCQEFGGLSYMYAYAASTITDIHTGAAFGAIPCFPFLTHLSVRAVAAATVAWQK